MTAMKTAVKKVDVTLLKKDVASTQSALKHAVLMLSKSASKGVIPKKRASRKISRLTLKVNKLAQ